MAKAIFQIVGTDKTFEGTFRGTVFTEVSDSKGRKYKANVPNAEVILIEHLSK